MKCLLTTEKTEMKTTISQTLIKALEEEKHCPMKIKAVYIDKTHKTLPTLSMMRGIYFEIKVLGTTAHEEKIEVLPPKKNGETTIDTERINLQIRNFPQALKKLGITM